MNSRAVAIGEDAARLCNNDVERDANSHRLVIVLKGVKHPRSKLSSEVTRKEVESKRGTGGKRGMQGRQGRK